MRIPERATLVKYITTESFKKNMFKLISKKPYGFIKAPVLTVVIVLSLIALTVAAGIRFSMITALDRPCYVQHNYLVCVDAETSKEVSRKKIPETEGKEVTQLVQSPDKSKYAIALRFTGDDKEKTWSYENWLLDRNLNRLEQLPSGEGNSMYSTNNWSDDGSSVIITVLKKTEYNTWKPEPGVYLSYDIESKQTEQINVAKASESSMGGSRLVARLKNGKILYQVFNIGAPYNVPPNTLGLINADGSGDTTLPLKTSSGESVWQVYDLWSTSFDNATETLYLATSGRTKTGVFTKEESDNNQQRTGIISCQIKDCLRNKYRFTKVQVGGSDTEVIRLNDHTVALTVQADSSTDLPWDEFYEAQIIDLKTGKVERTIGPFKFMAGTQKNPVNDFDSFVQEQN